MSPTVVEYGSLDLGGLGKIRCRVLDRASGDPIGGVVVHLALGLGDGARARLPVSALCSDATGYLSFDLQRLTNAGLNGAGALLVSAPQLGIKYRDLLAEVVKAAAGEDAEETSGGSRTASTIAGLLLLRSRDEVVSDGGSLDIVFPIWAEKERTERVGCATPGLPAVQAPDTVDYELSPYSFVMPTPTLLDSDCCEQLVPSTLPDQEHSFYDGQEPFLAPSVGRAAG